MKMFELIKMAESLPKTNSCVYSLAEDIGIYELLNITEIDEIRFQEIMPVYWYCTDQYVGLTFYYLDKVFVGYSEQQGRKSDKIYKWHSKETYKDVYDFISSFINKEENIELIDMNEEIASNYNVSFYNQLLTNSQKYKYNGLAIVNIEDGDKGNCISQKAKVILSNDENIIINVKDIEIQYF